MNRWVVYQRERFRLLSHTPLVLAFSGSAVCLSSLLRGHIALPSARTSLVACLTSLLFFLQLRIADEFKDLEEDARFRAYRPVPRGLVTLTELGWLAAITALVQLGLALCLPLIDLHATACDWRVAGLVWPPAGLHWFIIVSFLNGFVIEIGRKIRAPANEEPGVQTYTVLWGRLGAVGAWLAVMTAAALCASLVAQRIGAGKPVGIAMLVVLLACAAAGGRFVRRPTIEGGNTIEIASGVWTLLMYLSLGAAPLTIAVCRAGIRP